jgi:hypothetical protein
MDRVSRPLLGLLLATVAAAVLWTTMLKPKDSSDGGGSPAHPSLGQLNTAIAAAHAAVNGSDQSSAASSGAGAQTTTSSTPPTHPAATPVHPVSATKPKPATHTRSATHTRPNAHRIVHRAAPPLTASQRVQLVSAALRRHQVLAMLFYNPAGADDRLVKQELARIDTHRGAVVKLAIPLRELASYSIITQQVPVTESPTLVIIDRAQGATQLVGFSSSFEIAQRIDDALAVG